MTPSERANLLIVKADEDIHVLRRLVDDMETSDEIWGFHAQQAVEKLLKALLVKRELSAPFTHRLLDLADILEDAGRDLPEAYQELLDLTPYAVEFRYSSLPADHADQLCRRAVLTDILGLREYVQQAVTTAQ